MTTGCRSDVVLFLVMGNTPVCSSGSARVTLGDAVGNAVGNAVGRAGGKARGQFWTGGTVVGVVDDVPSDVEVSSLKD